MACSIKAMDNVGVHFIAQWEDFIPYVYDDKAKLHRVGKKLMPPEWFPGMAVIGTLTIGFGHTDEAAHPLKMKDCAGKRHITEEEAYEILAVDLDEIEQFLTQVLPAGITQNQYNACGSLTFNMGTTNFKKSRLLSAIKRGDMIAARAAFDLYVKSKGEVMAGLQNRRDAEQRLWDEMPVEQVPVPAADFVQTPRALDPAAPAKNMMQSKIAWSQVIVGTGTLIATTSSAANKVLDAVNDPVEQVTKVVDRTGTVVSSTTALIKRVKPEPDGITAFFKATASVITDPINLIMLGTVILLAAGLTLYERKRHSQEGSF